MPTKNVNTNINNIKIEIPKQKQYRPRQKSVREAEEELQQLENADANYRMGNPINVSVVQPPTINPSVFGFTNIPVQREITETSKGEAISKPVEVPPVEVPPVEESTKKKGGRPRGSKNAPKVAIGVPINESLVTDYLGTRSDFPSKNKEAAKNTGYIQSPLDEYIRELKDKGYMEENPKYQEQPKPKQSKIKMTEEEKAQKKVEKEQKKEEVKKAKTGLRGGPTMAED